MSPLLLAVVLSSARLEPVSPAFDVVPSEQQRRRELVRERPTLFPPLVLVALGQTAGLAGLMLFGTGGGFADPAAAARRFDPIGLMAVAGISYALLGLGLAGVVYVVHQQQAVDAELDALDAP